MSKLILYEGAFDTGGTILSVPRSPNPLAVWKSIQALTTDQGSLHDFIRRHKNLDHIRVRMVKES